MSQAESLLNSLSEEEIAKFSNAAEKHITIGRDRIIVVPEELKRIAVQFDHDVETVTFDCVRYWDDVDMSTMKIYINYLLPNGARGSYLAQNVEVDSEVDTIMHFTWTISSALTQVKGKIKFLICINEVDRVEGTEIRHWNSELNDELYVSEGLEVSAMVVTQNRDVITQLLTRMDEIEALGFTPTINLIEKNVPALTIGGAPVLVQTDTTEMMSLLNKGAVRLIFTLNMYGENIPVDIVVNAITAMGSNLCAYMFNFEGVNLLFTMEVSQGGFSMAIKDFFAAATSINMSAFDSEGKITQTYSDGSSDITTVEFDGDGNPTKITDGNGNVTQLTW